MDWQYENIVDNILLKSGIVTLTGAKDDVGSHLITFQSQQQMKFTQFNFSSLIESLHAVIMYYKSAYVSFLVDMSHCNQMFIDHYIHVLDQLERKTTKSKIKRVYIVRPARKSIQKHLANELGSKKKGNTRLNAQVVIVKALEELFQYIKQRNLTTDFNGTLEHDHIAWLSVQKMLTSCYRLVTDIVTSSDHLLQKIRELTSAELGIKAEKNLGRAQIKRMRNIEKRKNEILRQCHFTKALEDGQRLYSYFQDPKSNEDFKALSKSPVFELDKERFLQHYRKILSVKDSIDQAWTDGVEKMKSFVTEQEFYDRLIEYCTWIVEKGLPYLTSLPPQSNTLAESFKRKINYENEFHKPVKDMLKKCRQTLKEVRNFQRFLRTRNGSLDLMADNLSSLVEDLKTKSEKRMNHFKKEKDFMQLLTKAESWCERASDLLSNNQIPQENDSKIKFFMDRHPPLSCKELDHLLEYVERADDFELRNRARLLVNRCQELRQILQAQETHCGEFSSDENSSESSYLQHGENFFPKPVPSPSSLPTPTSADLSSKRWHDDVMSSTTISNNDVTMSRSTQSANENSRLADIKRRLRDQELLYEQLIIEEELRELAQGTLSPQDTYVSAGFNESFGHENKTLFSESGGIKSSGKARDEKCAEQTEFSLGSNLGYTTLDNTAVTTEGIVNDKQRSMFSSSNLNRSDEVENANGMIKTASNGGRAVGFQSTKKSKNSDGKNLKKGSRSQKRCKRSSPSHVDLLDGCDNLKRLCRIENHSLQNDTTLPTFGKHSNLNRRNIESDSNPTLPSNGISVSSNRTNDFQRFFGHPVVRDLRNSRDITRTSDSLAASMSPNISPDTLPNVASEEFDVGMTRDYGNRSRVPESRAQDFKRFPCDIDDRSHEEKDISRDEKDTARDTNEKSREQLLNDAKEAVNHWTRIKNEQRARLAQVIDDMATRKTIEETYFNAQVRLCRARQDVAKLGNSERSLTSFPLEDNGEINNNSTSFDLSMGIGSGQEVKLGGMGAFRRFTKDVGNETVEGEPGEMLDNEGSSGITRVKNAVEKEEPLDNEGSLGMGGGVEGPGGESSKKDGTSSEDRVQTQENGVEYDSEQESSDEFDDDVEEEELMLLCSQSSSGLMSQDELKDSLQEEQAKLEEMFRQQKERLKIEREKLIEEEKRIYEWESRKMEAKDESLAVVDESWKVGETKVLYNENSILDKSSDNTLGQQSQPHDIKESQHGLSKPNQDIDESQLEMPALPSQLLISQKGQLYNETLSPEHEIPVPEHEMPSPGHGMPSTRHEIPSPQHKVPSSQHEIPSLEHKTSSPQHKVSSSQHEIPSPQHKIPSPQHEILSPQHEIPSSQIVEDKDSLVTEMKPRSHDIDTKKFREPKDEIIKSESDVNDLSEIVVGNFDSDDESKKQIEEELINILHERSLKSEESESDDLDVIGEETSSNIPPLISDGLPPPMIDDDDDIDLMNQLIDDLIISDREDANQDENNLNSFGSVQLNGDDHRIDVDNVGINLEDRVESTEGDGRISKDSVEDCDGNKGIHLDDLGVNNIDMNMSNLSKNADKPKTNMNDGVIEKNISRAVHDGFESKRDGHHLKTGKVNAGLENKGTNKPTHYDVEIPIERQGEQDDEFELDVDLVLHVDAVENNRLMDLSCRETPEDETFEERKIQQNEELDIDVDFTLDLKEDKEIVEGNELIDILRNQSDAFSSQDSLDDDQLSEETPQVCETPEAEELGQVVRTNNESATEEIEKLEPDVTTIKPHPRINSEGTTDGYAEKQSTISNNAKNESILHQRYKLDAQGYLLMDKGHRLMSEDSDDDFGRVLEDIQEEESEYEDLMGYRSTQTDSNDNRNDESAKIVVPSESDLRSARSAYRNLNLSVNAPKNALSFASAVIIDAGSGYCKAGFSIDEQPRVKIPSVVGMPRSQVVASGHYKDYYVGEEAEHLHQVLNLHRPLKNGLVQDWDLMEKLLDEVYEELHCESDEYPVLLSEPVLNPKSNREEMIQVMFETFHAPAAYTCAQAVLSLFATGRTTGLVYDCGYGKAHSIPVYEGYALPHATTTNELAGSELTTCLSRMLRDRGVNMESQTELKIVQDIKEKLCYVVMDYDTERKAYNTGERNDTTYTMPDGGTIAIGSERFRCPEVLFTPSMVGMATDGVHEILYKTALKCAIDVRTSLFQNIVISGGSTMFPGFCRRLHTELCKLLGTRTSEAINIDAVDDRNVLTWQGGAILSKLSNFQSMWINASEYEEFGPGIVHKKCV